MPLSTLVRQENWKMGIEDYKSKIPDNVAIPISMYDKLFVAAAISSLVNAVEFLALQQLSEEGDE